MTPDDNALLARLHEYARRRKIKIHEHIGGGIQGIVCSTTLPSAIKAFKAPEHYWREVAVYTRIKELKITEVCGFSVPRPLAHHDELMVIHMEIVRPPFVVDFASAGVDAPLFEFPPDVLVEYEAQRREMFEDRWPQAKRIVAEFRRYGIYLSDVKPGNIMFAD